MSLTDIKFNPRDGFSFDFQCPVTKKSETIPNKSIAFMRALNYKENILQNYLCYFCDSCKLAHYVQSMKFVTSEETKNNPLRKHLSFYLKSKQLDRDTSPNTFLKDLSLLAKLKDLNVNNNVSTK